MTTANRDQAEHWNNDDEVGHWIRYQDRYDAMLGPFADVLLDAAGLQTSERVLDVGCGCGATTIAAARSVNRGTARGIDLSAPMLDRARTDAEAAGLDNAFFDEGDAQVHPFGEARFDAVISRFGMMVFRPTVSPCEGW